MITYNHQPFIAKAIEGILMQVTDFPYRLMIGDDWSTDGTRAICEDFANRFPDKITLLPNTSNLGMLQNFLRTYRACDGEYIAFCEGDDYWTDPLKLSKQVEFLLYNPIYSACFHNVEIRTQREGMDILDRMHISLPKDSFGTEDVLGPWFIASPSFVFVNYKDFELPDWYFHCRYGDLPFMLLLSLRGNFKYIDEVMAVYRLHDSGMTTVHKSYDKIMLMVYIYSSFDIHTGYKFHNTIRNSVIYEIERHAPLRPAEMKKESPVPQAKKAYRRVKEFIYKKVYGSSVES